MLGRWIVENYWLMAQRTAPENIMKCLEQDGRIGFTLMTCDDKALGEATALNTQLETLKEVDGALCQR